ncbi:MAG TPA: hypothetical protein PKK00_06235 [Bacteroidales bacterium]|nr:hypothetical protein [Bacteroidales bacterium]HPS16888.1 hypothetical protein [Bacteroidales bacterium]
MNILDITINLNVTIIISVAIIVVTFGTTVFYLIRHPETLEKWASIFYRVTKYLLNKGEYQYVKYDIQSKVNSYSNKLSKDIPNLSPSNIVIHWINENQTREQFIKNNAFIIRMHKSVNQNKNLVNASMAYISGVLLRKAKSYIAKYQKDSIDLYVAYKLFENQKADILDQFVSDFLRDGLEKDKVGQLYDNFFDIGKAGIFFPVFIQEMNFLGEKIFAKGAEKEKIYKEVTELVALLYCYANRKFDEKGANEFVGSYCKFTIRILGKKFKIDNEGKKIYINDLKKISSEIETIYLIGNITNKSFIKSVINESGLDYSIYFTKEYAAIIKDKEGQDYEVQNFLMVLRNNKIAVYHKK